MVYGAKRAMSSETHFTESGSSPPSNPQQSRHYQSALPQSDPLDLDVIDERFRAQSMAALNAGNVIGFLIGSEHGNGYSVDIVQANLSQLLDRGLYEQAPVQASVSTSTNHVYRELDELAHLFALADRDRLHAAGQSLPHDGPFTVYRGVAGCGEHRRVCGISWTGNLERAKWFARRCDLHDPAVYTVTVPKNTVLSYVDQRKEDEYLLWSYGLPTPKRVRGEGP
jgi:hypothetical protein